MSKPAHQSKRQNEEVDLSKEQIELRDLLGNLGGGSPKFLNQLLELAKKKPSKNDNPSISNALSNNSLTTNNKNLARVRNAVKEYRKKHRRPKQHVRRAREQKKEKPAKPLVKAGSLFTSQKYTLIVHNELDHIADLHTLKKRYFGMRNTQRPTEVAVPEDLREVQMKIKDQGHSFFEILDHLLMAKSLSPVSQVASVLRIYPPNSEDVTNALEYRAALTQLDRVLLTGTDLEVLDMLAESGEFVSKLYLKHLSSFLTKKQKYPYGKYPGPILEIEPGATLIPYVQKLKAHSQMHVVSSDQWEAFVISEVGRCYNAKKIEVSSEIDQSRLPQDFAAIHVNGDRFLGSHVDTKSIEQLATKLRKNGQFVFDFSATAINRFFVTRPNFYQIFKAFIEVGKCSFDVHFAKTKSIEVDTEIKQLFYPATHSDRDQLIFTKRPDRNVAEELEMLDSVLDIMVTYSLFQDPFRWNDVEESLRGMNGLSSTVEEMAENLGLVKEEVSSKEISDYALKLLAKKEFEHLASFLVEHHMNPVSFRNRIQDPYHSLFASIVNSGMEAITRESDKN